MKLLRGSLFLLTHPCLHLLPTIQATELAGGQIITRTNVEAIADHAKDIRDMHHECYYSTSEDESDAARDIYHNGKNTEFSLSSLSLKSDYQQGWTFGIQKYGLLRGDLSPDSLKEWEEEGLQWFAHDFVMTQFEKEECYKATNAALVLNVWMMASYELWQGWEECRRLSDPNYFVDFDPNAKADEFIAYWVGSLQDDMAHMGGHSLFSITNEAAQYFNTIDRNGVAFANSAIVAAYEEASAILSKSDACSQDDAEGRTIQELWKVYHVISSEMLVPMMQHLLKAMIEQDPETVRLYATIVVPQTSQCRTSTFELLKARLLDRPYDIRDFVVVYQALISTFECLGISCDDIGVPNGHSVPICFDSSLVLAEYPAGSQVRQVAKIDLDVHQMEILMKLNEHDMARHMYLYGKNSLKISESDDDDNDFDDDYYSETKRERMSLHSLALSNERRGVMYEAFLDYHDDFAYSDKIILQLLEGEGKWGNWPADFRAKIISDIIRVQVVYMVVISKLEMAVTQCSDLFWDEAAALIIGSLEGKERGGSKDFRDGKLLWGLANRRGLGFQRLNHENYGIVNGSIENLLFSGKGKMIAGSCANLGHTAQRITHLLLIPVIQSVVKYAISNEFVSVSSAEVEVALGEVNANVLIPIFSMYDTDSADLIKRNMVATTFGILVESGPQAVADAYLNIAESFGIECDYIGVRYEVDACANYKDILKDPDNEEEKSSVSIRHVSHLASFLIASFAVVLIV